jgi:murein DD-endopeptidase MepM/ murein hydrolase activator NlpD
VVLAATVALLSSCVATPAPPATSAGQSAPAVNTASPTASTAPSAPPVRYVFPVAGKADYGHSHHDYPATDIFAACGTPVVSPVDGVILELSRVDLWDPKVNDGATRGGHNVSILGDDGVRYYGAHFATIEAAVNPGVRVTAGQTIATVGRTGDTTVCHVHFGISPLCARLADWWIRRGVIWPWSYLDAWRSGEARSPVSEINAWQAQHGCPAKPLTDP